MEPVFFLLDFQLERLHIPEAQTIIESNSQFILPDRRISLRIYENTKVKTLPMIKRQGSNASPNRTFAINADLYIVGATRADVLEPQWNINCRIGCCEAKALY